MDKILNLNIAYPDFQLNQVIDPDQVDLNNSQITAKINEIASKFNTLITGNTGASNISVKQIDLISGTATNIQGVIEEIVNKLVAVGGASLIGTNGGERGSNVQQFLSTLDNAVNELQHTVGIVVSKTDSFETASKSHDQRLTNIEATNIEQISEINSLKEKTTNIETTNRTQDTQISELKERDIFHDTQIATLNSITTNHTTRVGILETKTNETSSSLSSIKQDIAKINTTNTNQEVVDARGIHTNLKERMEYNEISIGSNPSTTSKMNFIVTDSNDTEFWEDKVAIASLEEHNIDPNAHGGTITSHNASTTAHEDIRKLINEKASTWNDIGGKPITFPPDYHTHTKAQIGDFAHTHTKSQVTDFAHTHTKSQVTDFAHSHTKSEIGLGNVDNIKQMPVTGGTFTGNVTMGSGTKLSGHFVIPYGKPANAVAGSIWLES